MQIKVQIQTWSWDHYCLSIKCFPSCFFDRMNILLATMDVGLNCLNLRNFQACSNSSSKWVNNALSFFQNCPLFWLERLSFRAFLSYHHSLFLQSCPSIRKPLTNTSMGEHVLALNPNSPHWQCSHMHTHTPALIASIVLQSTLLPASLVRTLALAE